MSGGGYASGVTGLPIGGGSRKAWTLTGCGWQIRGRKGRRGMRRLKDGMEADTDN